MNDKGIPPKFTQLRRSQTAIKRLIQSRTTELEKSLKDEFSDRTREQQSLLQKRAAELTEINDVLRAEIAAREHIEKLLSESETRYRSMADATPVLIWQSGPDKRCTYFNNGWLDFTGRTLEQELGDGCSEGVHPDDYRRCLNTYVSAFERREPFVLEYRLRHRSGSYRWILDRGVPQFNSDGTFIGYTGGAIDTHDRKLAEQELRESEERERKAAKFNQAVMASMGEGLYTLDSQGMVTYINPAAERMFGWSSGELLGRKMHDVTHYRHPDGTPFPAAECAGLRVLQKGIILSAHEDFFIRKDGTLFPVVYSSSPITSGEKVVGLVVVFRDVTARKQAHEDLHRSEEALRTLAARLQAVREEERTELAREIHDELSGTLTALKMDLSLLPDRAAKGHRPFLEKVSSMSALIDRTLARVRSIVSELRPAVLDQFGLLAAIEWQVAEFQDRSGIACEVHLPIELEQIAPSPELATALFRILQEALTNVARHARAHRVVVNLRKEAGSVILTVQDDGKGIEDEAIHARDSIGLLGMRERALSLGGATEVTRLPEGGTLVRVRIPMG